MKKILVISDVHRNTHGLMSILNENKDIDMKLFLGDFEELNIDKQKELTALFDYSVVGNCDRRDISPISQIIDVDGLRIFMTHGHYYGSLFKKIDFKSLVKSGKENKADLILHGHDHIEHDEIIDGIRVVNPGSITHPRSGNKPSYAILEINNSELKKVKIIYL